MKKVIGTIISLVVLIAMAIDGYFVFIKDRLTGASNNATTSQSSSTTAQASSSSSSTSSSSSSSSKYKNGTYTGKAVSTKWGDVQVQAKISNGKITKVNVLEYPNENGHDQEINSTAIPTYKSEALKAQSAKISLMSGASETYKGFTGSLQNALDEAEA